MFLFLRIEGRFPQSVIFKLGRGMEAQNVPNCHITLTFLFFSETLIQILLLFRM